MIITATILRDLGACESGITQFAELVGPDGFRGEWTYQHQIALLLCPAREHLGFLRQHRLVPMYHMSGANLSRANLYGADLSRANLSRADLSRADLSHANLSGANLTPDQLATTYQGSPS